VIARNSTFAYKGKAVDVRGVARELGVRYILEGSSRKVVNRVRVTAQLIDGLTGKHIWAERYDRELSDIFAVQEEITRTIVASIAPEIESDVLAGVRRAPPANLTAYELAARAWFEGDMAYLSGEAAMLDCAVASALRAVELDPECVRAWTVLALLRWQSEFYSGRQSTPDTCKPGFDAARRAIALDRFEHRAYMAKGLLHVRLAQHDDALGDLRLACELNPNDPRALQALAFVELLNGDGPVAKARLTEALRLSPRDPMRYNAFSIMSNICFLTGAYAEGLEWVALSKREHPNFPPTVETAIKLHVGLGQLDRARAEAGLLRRIAPDREDRARRRASNMRRPEDREREIRFLRIGYGLEDVASSAETPVPPPALEATPADARREQGR
jgi:tetratricopeptide (TPR) repeat protein